ncbi:MAG: UDP-3-O-acyl-N-acetylglucosamine deacetylase [Phycisphaeraceae bacterium]|nr:UDP-3-O-acyl-N-acetylglucosamine deacetylase [Phycisphaeraceae bacterium]MCW5753825.1 UDP-3-O-acyl-N-acetylglucosamine deacetylase [Phycisphaeraceae bacterium]
MNARCTLAGPVAARGEALFSGRPAMFAIRPAENGGIRFRRVDLPGRPEIPALIDHLDPTPVHAAFRNMPARCTTLGTADARIALTEHILGALHGLGITDAVIEVDGPEMPIFDGSAGMFTIQIRAIGVTALPDCIAPVPVTTPITINDGKGGIITASPRTSPGCSYTYHLDYGPNPALAPQSATWTRDDDRSGEIFARQVAPARTFCLEEEARAMHKAGLFTHLDFSDMLVLGPYGPIDNELRYIDEPSRHKLLDLIGDLALVGRPIQADIVATRSGHALNHELARAIARL